MDNSNEIHYDKDELFTRIRDLALNIRENREKLRSLLTKVKELLLYVHTQEDEPSS